MPEGDTIRQIADRLHRALVGQRVRVWLGTELERFLVENDRDADSMASLRLLDDACRDSSHLQSSVEHVQSRGKHLLIRMDDQRTIHSHLGMTGSWHMYALNRLWHKPIRRASLILRFDRGYCVCFSPKVLQLLSATQLLRHPQLSNLGPDLLDRRFEISPALQRFEMNPHLEIGVALMDQRVVCGIGNVYKSELLFIEKIHPWDRVGDVAQQRIANLLIRARRLMTKNLDGRPRRTRFGRDGCRHWVYRRQGSPCTVCGAAIRMSRQGNLGRSTYWCPGCQTPG